jgi:hypothetical protein
MAGHTGYDLLVANCSSSSQSPNATSELCDALGEEDCSVRFDNKREVNVDPSFPCQRQFCPRKCGR